MENKESVQVTAQQITLVFIAGTFIGITLGPRVLSAAKKIILLQSSKMATEFGMMSKKRLSKNLDSPTI